MLFDTHAHMDDRAFDEDRQALLASLEGAGVGLVMNPGCSLESSRNVDKLTREYPWLYGAVGSHPDACDEVTESVIEEYRMLCKQNPKIKAIGEIGLDYHYEDIPREIQQLAFRRQMALAKELGLPVIVHERDAHADGMAIVSEFPEVTGVFHCYSGSLEDAKTLVKLGWYLGFNGAVTFKNAKKAPEVAAWVPADRLLVETDAPYLAPVPHRGKRCDSAMISHVLDFLAPIRPESREELERITWENALRFYNL
jgi:TatD DNase family protein